jgi:hypothetical protein
VNRDKGRGERLKNRETKYERHKPRAPCRDKEKKRETRKRDEKSMLAFSFSASIRLQLAFSAIVYAKSSSKFKTCVSVLG